MTVISPESGLKAVQCVDLVRDFGEGPARTTVLHGLNLDIAFGERLFLVGPSGCGKTTLISLMAGLLIPTSGSVALLGTDLASLAGDRLVSFRSRHIGFVFQQFNLIPALTATENVAVPLLLQGVGYREAQTRAAQMLERLEMGKHLHKQPVQMSGGQQQRVAVARSLVHDPQVLICDEPTASLDAQAGQLVMELLQEVAASPSRAVIVVTHDNRILPFATRVVHLSDGRIVPDGHSSS
ncbi:MAG TPA: ABC transporter ATP-binding protein [Planctomycetaceae bacterium]|nr:ABC transporter ATP-binding protein [Planctomycetaceae bacterium]